MGHLPTPVDVSSPNGGGVIDVSSPKKQKNLSFHVISVYDIMIMNVSECYMFIIRLINVS